MLPFPLPADPPGTPNSDRATGSRVLPLSFPGKSTDRSSGYSSLRAYRMHLVRDVMSHNVLYVTREATVRAAVELMLAH